MKSDIRKPQLIWYVLANRTEATIYRSGSRGKFYFLQRLKNKDGAKPERNLASARGGYVSGRMSGGLRHNLNSEPVKHEHVARLFASQLAGVLEIARQDRKYDELVLVAEPRFLGLLKSCLSNETRRVVQQEINKEFVYRSQHEIQSSVLQAIRERKSI